MREGRQADLPLPRPLEELVGDEPGALHPLLVDDLVEGVDPVLGLGRVDVGELALELVAVHRGSWGRVGHRSAGRVGAHRTRSMGRPERSRSAGRARSGPPPGAPARAQRLPRGWGRVAACTSGTIRPRRCSPSTSRTTSPTRPAASRSPAPRRSSRSSTPRSPPRGPPAPSSPTPRTGTRRRRRTSPRTAARGRSTASGARGARELHPGPRRRRGAVRPQGHERRGRLLRVHDARAGLRGDRPDRARRAPPQPGDPAGRHRWARDRLLRPGHGPRRHRPRLRGARPRRLRPAGRGRAGRRRASPGRDGPGRRDPRRRRRPRRPGWRSGCRDAPPNDDRPRPRRPRRRLPRRPLDRQPHRPRRGDRPRS